MDIYLIDNQAGYTFHFMVNPLDGIAFNKKRRFTTADVIEKGEYDQLKKGEKIRELSFKTLFPVEYDASFCRYNGFSNPKEYVKRFEDWVDKKEPLRLIITDYDFNGLVTISDFTPTEKPGEVGDKYIDITFRTYRETSITTVAEENSYSGGLEERTDQSDSGYKKGDKVKVTASSLNVRSGPGTNNSAIGTVNKGTTLEIWRVSENWADVYWGDSGGWICLDYVTSA